MSEIKTLNGYSLADTKARADIATLSKEIEKLKETQPEAEEKFVIDYVVGGIDGTTGENTDAYTRIRTENYIPYSQFEEASFDGNRFKMAWFAYDSAYNKIASSSWTYNPILKSTIAENGGENAKYVRFIMGYKTDGTTITLSAVEEAGLKIVVSSSASNHVSKKISIYGDSISTYEGYIPEGNRYTYPGCGVTSVDETWWKKTVDTLKMELLVNNSWSGRCVSNAVDASSGNINSGGWRAENVAQLGADGVSPDVIIVKLGINDVNRNVPLGEYNGTQEFPADATNFREAYAIMLKEIMSIFPLAEVWCCTLMQSERNGAASFPEATESGKLVVEYNAAIREMADLFGAKILDHASCGITYYNLAHYMGDWDAANKQGLHPNPAGHRLIALDTIKTLDPTAKVD